MLPLNDVQGMMRRWTSLLPYNALHLLQLAGHADIERWREAAATPLTELGFQPPRTATKYTELITGIQAELNRPFSAGDSPLRFFVIEGSGAGHHLGIAFDHWIADSESVRFLMRRILENYRIPGSTSKLPPLRVCEKPFHEIFGRANPAVVVAESLRNYIRHLRAYRIHIREPLDFSCGFQHLQLPDGLVENLHRSARQLGASVNDIFLAAAAQALGCHTAADRTGRPRRMFRPKRDCVALSTAMDIRPLANVSLDQQFGLFVS